MNSWPIEAPTPRGVTSAAPLTMLAIAILYPLFNPVEIIMRLTLSLTLLCATFNAVAANTCNDQRELLFVRDQAPATDPAAGNAHADIFVIRADASGERRLTDGASAKPAYTSADAAWSRDGSQIVFTSDRPGNTDTELYRMAADASGVKALSDNEALDEYPDWSGSSRLLFSSNRDGGAQQLYLLDANATQTVRLTEQGADDIRARWAPDGKGFAFTRATDGKWRVFVRATENGMIRPLSAAWMSTGEAAWTPDGHHLVVSSDAHAPDSGHLELFSLEVRDRDGDGVGDNIRRLTHTPAATLNTEPDVSTDGNCVLFVRARRDNPNQSEIYVMPMKGGDAIKVTDGYAPRWRPHR